MWKDDILAQAVAPYAERRAESLEEHRGMLNMLGQGDLDSLDAALAVFAGRAVSDALGILLVVQLFGLLVSPISWVHHWVWIIPLGIWLVHGTGSRRRGARAVELLPREFQMLEYLMRRQRRVVTRTMLLEGVWDYHFDPRTNVIDVHISRLRRKVDAEGEAALIRTVRGAGYMLSDR